jgi:hypothetical protein
VKDGTSVHLFRGRLARIGFAVAARAGFTRSAPAGRAGTGARAGRPHGAAHPAAPAEDAVASTMSALFASHRPGDFVAVELVLRDGRFTRDQLVGLLRERDPGYDPYHFVRALAELPKIPDAELRSHGLDGGEIAAMRARFADWFHVLIGGGIP